MTIECNKSPDEKHHYEMCKHAVHIPNGNHICYSCHYCNDKQCKTTFFKESDPLALPTKEEL